MDNTIITNRKLDTINASILQCNAESSGDLVNANIKLQEIKVVLEAEKTVLDNTLNAINTNILKASFNGEPILVVCDENGVLKSNKLSPNTDGTTIFGTTDGINRVMIVTDEIGKLQTTDTDLNSKILTTNTSLSNILTETLGVKSVITQTTNGHLIDIKTIIEAVRVLTLTINTNINSIAINNNLDVITRRLIDETSQTFTQFHSFSSVDLGTGANRYRSVTYAGSILNFSGFTITPEIIIQLSSDNINFYSDGTVCSFYKETNNLWQFVFQRADISMRYCRLHFKQQITTNNIYETISKN
jgi:hypothetical protein